MQQISLLLFQFIVFTLLCLSCFYLPGYLVLRRVVRQLHESEFIPLAFCLGFIFFLLNTIFWGFLHLRFMAYLPIGLVLLWVLYTDKFNFFKPFISLVKMRFLLFLLLISIVVQGMINFPSGIDYGSGLLFWSSQGHDGLWHVALMEEVKKAFPPQNPLYAGELIYNYHYLVDLIMGEFVRLFPFISSLDFYFRFFPVLLAVVINLGSYGFVRRWKDSHSAGLWAIFFTALCGSFGYVVTFMNDGKIFGGETIFWASQNNTILGNPPHAIAFTFIITFLIGFYQYLKAKNYYWLGICFALGALLSGFKVSGGFVLLAGVGLASLIDIIFNKNRKTILFFIPLGISNYAVFKLLTHGGESFLIWQPWWFIRTMIVGRLDWLDLEHKRQFYLDRGGFRGYARVLEYELLGFGIFLFGNIGMRFLGFFEVLRGFFQKHFYKNTLEFLLLGSMISAFMMPMLFIQKGISYNNIQFIQYFFLFLGFYAAATVSLLINRFKNKVVKIILAIVVIALSAPTAIGNLNEFYGPNSSPLARISNSEMSALAWLKENTAPDSVVMVSPYNKDLFYKYDFNPKPIFAWYSTAYIPAIGSRRTFVSAEEQLDIMDYPLKERLEREKDFFKKEEVEEQKQFLRENHISYIYLPKAEKPKRALDLGGIGLQKAFENDEVEILRVL